MNISEVPSTPLRAGVSDERWSWQGERLIALELLYRGNFKAAPHKGPEIQYTWGSRSVNCSQCVIIELLSKFIESFFGPHIQSHAFSWLSRTHFRTLFLNSFGSSRHSLPASTFAGLSSLGLLNMLITESKIVSGV